VFLTLCSPPALQTGISLLLCADQELDMNDSDTLGFYTAMQIFLNHSDAAKSTLQFPSTLTSQQRRIVRTIAVKLRLDHVSHGIGGNRFITVTLRSTSPSPRRESQGTDASTSTMLVKMYDKPLCKRLIPPPSAVTLLPSFATSVLDLTNSGGEGLEL
jgi:hypothetical protein